MQSARHLAAICILLTLVTGWPLKIEASDEALTLGVFPRRNAETTVRYFKPIADHLARELARPVNLVTARDYEAFWEGVDAKRYDIVHYNQYHYVRSAREQGYRVILKNEEFGRSTLSGVLFVQRDSDIKTLADLKGKKIVFGGGPTAMISTILPTYLLRRAGIEDDDYSRDFAKTPPAAVFAAYYGHAEAGGAGDVSTLIPSVTNQIDVTKLRSIAISDPVSHLPWAVSGEMSLALKEKITVILSGLGTSDEGRKLLDGARLTGLLPATDNEYNLHRRIIWEVLGEDYCSGDCPWLMKTSVATAGKGPLVMGIFPRRPQKMTISMFTPLADYLSKALGREVELVVAKDFKEFWKGVTEKRFDLVHYNQYHYVKSHKLYDYHAINRNEEQRQSLVSPVIWTRRDSGIKQLADLRGKKIIFGGGKDAMMAYIGPVYLLRRAGLTEADYESVLAINPLAGCQAMYLGQADACGSGDIMFRLPVLAKKVDINEVEIIGEGKPLAFLVWAVNGSMPESRRNALQQQLSGLTKTEEGRKLLKSIRATAILTSSDSDYDPHREIIRIVSGEEY